MNSSGYDIDRWSNGSLNGNFRFFFLVHEITYLRVLNLDSANFVLFHHATSPKTVFSTALNKRT